MVSRFAPMFILVMKFFIIAKENMNEHSVIRSFCENKYLLFCVIWVFILYINYFEWYNVKRRILNFNFHKDDDF